MIHLGNQVSALLVSRQPASPRRPSELQPDLDPVFTGHVTRIEASGDVYRWVCACGDVGKWTRRGNAQRGGGKHAALMNTGQGLGVKIDEHW